MIRLTACQLCLLQRSVTASASARSFSIGKVKWRKAALPALKQVEELSPEVGEEELRDVRTNAVGAEAKTATHGRTLAIKSVVLDKEALIPLISKGVKEAPISDAPLKLVNAVDPKVLDEAAKEAQQLDLSKLPMYYLGLSKSRLTGLVVVTAMAGYALAPAAFAIVPFASLTLGTALTSASANTINQIMEVEFDSQMDRTKNRVLVRNHLSIQHAQAFAAVTGLGGVALLGLGANPLTAALGGLNLLLYTCMYTPMKRRSIANTWVGSVVGGIPPLMGWAACTGQLSHGALLLGGILYAWQFPHFNALSWNLRKDYDKAGYKMMAISHPDLCKKTSVRYSLGIIAMSSLAPACNVTSWTFVLDSLPLNGYLVYLAYKFQQDGDSASSRKLFRFSLIHLPVLIMLMMISKQNYAEKKCTSTSPDLSQVGKSIEPPPPLPQALLSISETATSLK